jgi:hypothetical protein
LVVVPQGPAKLQSHAVVSAAAGILLNMYRRGLLATAALLVGLGVWIGSWNFTVTTGGSFGATPRDHLCGSTIGVFWRESYAPGIEGSFLRRRCYLESKQRVASLGFLGGLAGLVATVGLVRGKAPPLRSIDVLTPLPTPDEMSRAGFGEPYAGGRPPG